MPEELKRVINRVIEWQNGMVMVFDQFGQQMPEYQGHKDAVWQDIIDAAPISAEICRGNWQKFVNGDEDWRL